MAEIPARKKIRDQCSEILKTIPAFNGNVFPGRITVIQEIETPCVCIYTNRETSEPVSMGKLSRNLTVSVQIYIKSNSNYEDDLDSICLDIEKAFLKDTTLFEMSTAMWPINFSKDLVQSNKNLTCGILEFNYTYQEFFPIKGPENGSA